jgi:hypothetical protein
MLRFGFSCLTEWTSGRLLSGVEVGLLPAAGRRRGADVKYSSQCTSHWQSTRVGPQHWQPLGEVEW